jgi:hypothetical protein
MIFSFSEFPEFQAMLDYKAPLTLSSMLEKSAKVTNSYKDDE